VKSSQILTSTVAAAILAGVILGPERAAAQSTPPKDNPLIKFRGVVAACGRTDSVSTIECGSYITGFVHGIQAAQNAAVIYIVADQVAHYTIPPTDKAIDTASKKAWEQLQTFCMRSDWTAGYVQAVVGQYAREHPESLDDVATDHMSKVFARAFPCGQGK
jgi:hypothetical protein